MDRAELAERWAAELSQVVYVARSRDDVEEGLGELLSALLATLRPDADPDEASAVGAAIVEAGFAKPECLRVSLDLLAPALAEVDGPRALEVVGPLAAGFAEATRDRLFTAQEDIRAALVRAKENIQRRLTASEARLAEVFRTSAVGIIISDLGGGIVKANEAVEHMLGHPKGTLFRKRLPDLFDPTQAPHLRTRYEELLTGEADHIHDRTQLLRADGELAWVRIAVSLLRDEDDRPNAHVTMVEDITDNHLLEQRIHHNATRDELTDLPNRTTFLLRLEETLRAGKEVMVVHLALDGLAAINNGINRSAGDTLLRTVAAKLTDLATHFPTPQPPPDATPHRHHLTDLPPQTPPPPHPSPPAAAPPPSQPPPTAPAPPSSQPPPAAPPPGQPSLTAAASPSSQPPPAAPPPGQPSLTAAASPSSQPPPAAPSPGQPPLTAAASPSSQPSPAAPPPGQPLADLPSQSPRPAGQACPHPARTPHETPSPRDTHTTQTTASPSTARHLSAVNHLAVPLAPESVEGHQAPPAAHHTDSAPDPRQADTPELLAAPPSPAAPGPEQTPPTFTAPPAFAQTPDTPVARVGGDEFALTLPYDRSRLSTLAADINDLLAEPVYIGDIGVAVTATIAIVSLPAENTAPLDLLRATDITLRDLKSHGRRQWALVDPEKTNRLQTRYALAAALPGAWENGDLDLDFHPVIDLTDHRVTAARATLRWDHPHGPLTPDSCDSVLAETGLTLPIANWLLTAAMTRAAAHRIPTLMVDLPPEQAGDQDLISTIQAALTASTLPPNRLQLGFPAASLHTDADAQENAEVVQELGIRLMLTNAGPSDLPLVEDHSPDTISLAPALVARLEDPTRDSLTGKLLTNLVPMLRATGAAVLAPRISTPAQATWWTAIGVNLAQGPHAGPPTPLDDFPLS